MKPDILLIGSDAELAQTVHQAAGDSHIWQTRSPHKAVELLSSRNIRLIIADLDPCGPSLLDALELCRSGIPLVAVSSLGLEYIAPVLRQHRKCTGLSKPVLLSALKETVERQLK